MVADGESDADADMPLPQLNLRKKIHRHAELGFNSEDATKVLVLQPDFKDARLQGVRPPQLQLEESLSLIDAVQGLTAVEGEVVRMRELRERTFFGKGKLVEVSARVHELKQRGCDVVMINTSRLTPRQQEFLQKSWGLPVYDRFTVILAIFESRAVSRQAQLQVELARIEYERARLVLGLEAGYDRQGGHSGTLGGAGETELEHNRRRLQRRELRIRELLRAADASRPSIRKGTKDMPVVAVVGYTNAGKTALVKCLTHDAGLEPENKLFATLDTTTRAGKLTDGTQCLFVDTVGFVADLPPTLVEAFRSTLVDLAAADVLVHVTDATDPDRLDQHACVIDVLEGLGLSTALLESRICVHNKIDLREFDDTAAHQDLDVHVAGSSRAKRERAAKLWRDHPALPISVHRGDNLEELLERITQAVQRQRGRVHRAVRFRIDQGDVLQYLHRHGAVQDHQVDADGLHQTVEVIMSADRLSQLVHTKKVQVGRFAD